MGFRNTADIPQAFWPRYEAICRAVGASDPFHALAVWMSESGVSAKAYDAEEHASGIFKATPDTLRTIGFYGANGYSEARGARSEASRVREEAARRGDEKAALSACREVEFLDFALSASFRTLDAEEQLVWAARYYQPFAGKLVSRAAWYVATFANDVTLPTEPHAWVKGGARRGWSYYLNAARSPEAELALQVRELEYGIVRACIGPRWDELDERLRVHLDLDPEPPPTSPENHDLRTVFGLQRALAVLGFHDGPLDGLPGPTVRAAVERFQRAQGLSADGIPGPTTREAVEQSLEALTPA